MSRPYGFARESAFLLLAIFIHVVTDAFDAERMRDRYVARFLLLGMILCASGFLLGLDMIARAVWGLR